MHNGVWVLVLVMLAGITGRNPLVTAAAGFLLLVASLPSRLPVALLERYSVQLGLTMLIVGLLAPFAAGRLGMQDMLQGLRGPLGITALLGGALSAWMCARGLALLETDPEVIIGLVAGTILGVGLMRGIPVGPLAAAGLTAIMYEMWRWWLVR
ncbi:MAG TPA: DUF441 domain-containing protein [Bacillota bacterium]